MISPEESKVPVDKICSPESKTSKTSADNVPREFEYVEPKKTESSYKIIAGGAIVICLIISVAITLILTVNGGHESKWKWIFFKMWG